MLCRNFRNVAFIRRKTYYNYGSIDKWLLVLHQVDADECPLPAGRARAPVAPAAPTTVSIVNKRQQNRRGLMLMIAQPNQTVARAATLQSERRERKHRVRNSEDGRLFNMQAHAVTSLCTRVSASFLFKNECSAFVALLTSNKSYVIYISIYSSPWAY